MIVVDSSVWIDLLRGRGSPEAQLLAALIGEQTIVVGDLILCEVLRGAASEDDAAEIERILRGFETADMVGDELAATAALNYRELRRRGVTIRKTVDLLIGTWCIENDHMLLHRDRDYDAMERHLGLAVLHA